MRKLLLAIVIIGGCASEDAEVPEQDGLPQGLTIFTAEPEAGLSGMFARDELAVFFETVREIELDPAPQHDQFTANGIAVNVSARFVDMEGRNLLVSIASHNNPERWAVPGEPSAAMLAARPALYDLALEAGQALEAHPLDVDVAPEQRTLAVTGILMRPPTVALPERTASPYYSAGNHHTQYFEVHSAECCLVAEHSSTVFWNISDIDGTWEDGWQTNNHGRWATEMPLESNCGGSGAWSGGGRPHYGAGRLQFCDMKNGYNACGVFGGNHNCHDDSKMQRANIVYGAVYGSAPGYCSGWGCDLNAPSCY